MPIQGSGSGSLYWTAAEKTNAAVITHCRTRISIERSLGHDAIDVAAFGQHVDLSASVFSEAGDVRVRVEVRPALLLGRGAPAQLEALHPLATVIAVEVGAAESGHGRATVDVSADHRTTGAVVVDQQRERDPGAV